MRPGLGDAGPAPAGATFDPLGLEVVEKFNPNHDPATGEFTSGSGGSLYRGLHLGISPDASDAEIIAHLKRNPGSSDAFEQERLAVDPDTVNKWPLFGSHWSTEADVGHTFSLHASDNLDHRGPGYLHGRDRTGVVLEARMKRKARPDSLLGGYGEKEVVWPGRDAIDSIIVHVHHLPAGQSIHRTDTYVRSFELPREKWETPKAVAKFNPNHDERGRFAESPGQWGDHTSPWGVKSPPVYRGFHAETAEELDARVAATKAGRLSVGADGKGIYLTTSEEVGRTYGSTASRPHAVVLQAQIKSSAKVLTFEEYTHRKRAGLVPKETADPLRSGVTQDPADYAKANGYDLYTGFSNNIVVVNPDVIEWGEPLLKFNPYHDELGRFTSGPSGGAKGSSAGSATPELKGDFNPGGRVGTTPWQRQIDDYLNVSDVDDDTVAAVRDAFEGEWGGLRSQVTDINATADGGNVHVNGIVLDGDDEQVGDFTRDIFPEEGEVSHQSLFIADVAQGRGFAKGFLSQSEAHYRAQGIKTVLVHAVDVGGYAWARAGFDFIDFTASGERRPGRPTDSILAKLEEVASYAKYSVADNPSNPYVHHAKTAQAILDRIAKGKHVSAREIASIGHDGLRFDPNVNNPEGDTVGQYIMIGEEWNGVKELASVRKDLDLDTLTDEDWAWIERACVEGAVRKFNPYHDPATGEFTSGPSASSAAGVIHGDPAPWKPTMTRDEAEEWAKDSVIQDVLTHTTADGNLRNDDGLIGSTGDAVWVGGGPADGGKWVPRGAAVQTDTGKWELKDGAKSNGILDVGFRVGGSGVFGDGIYLGMEPLVEGRDGGNADPFDGHPLDPPKGDPIVHDEQALAYAYGADREGAPTLRVKVDVRNPFVVDIIERPGVSFRDPAKAVADALDARHGVKSDLLSDDIRSLGYDALVIRHPGPFEWNVGGDQIVLWDPKQATVIVDDQGQPEDYRYRKFNPYHDHLGRFTSGPGSGSSSPLPSRWDSMTLNEQEDWAESDANPYKTGRVLGGDRSSSDFRVEVDPRRRFTELWQRTYDGYAHVRQATVNVLNGDPPLDGVMYDMNVPYPRSWNGDPGDRTWRYGKEDYAQDLTSAGKWMADQIRAAKPGTDPVTDTLWRGATMTRSAVDRLRTQKSITLGPTSTSADRETAMKYQRGTGYRHADSPHDEVRVMFHFEARTRRVNLDLHSDWGGSHPEQVVTGEFEILSVELQGGDVRVNLAPVKQP